MSNQSLYGFILNDKESSDENLFSEDVSEEDQIGDINQNISTIGLDNNVVGQIAENVVVSSNIQSKAGMYIPGTSRLYETYLKKFAKFVNVDYIPNQPLPREVYTDSNIAAWFEDLYKSDFKPHLIKSAKAAIHSDFTILGLQKIHLASDNYKWPLTSVQRKKISTMGKIVEEKKTLITESINANVPDTLVSKVSNYKHKDVNQLKRYQKGSTISKLTLSLKMTEVVDKKYSSDIRSEYQLNEISS
mmetsp:Transcript_13623/g.12336  ORF Transcript_13623/g.12336 Transcript_13623/m.12336 type:complete len:246 (-) Transcript_13623:66-803(-)